jgi:hypothetical protein
MYTLNTVHQNSSGLQTQMFNAKTSTKSMFLPKCCPPFIGERRELHPRTVVEGFTHGMNQFLWQFTRSSASEAIATSSPSRALSLFGTFKQKTNENCFV